MSAARPTQEELVYVGFTELQLILLSDVPDEVALEAYLIQIEKLMTGDDSDVDF